MRNRLILTQLPIPYDQVTLASFVTDASHPNTDAFSSSLIISQDDVHKSPQTSYKALVKQARSTSFRPHLAIFGLDLANEHDEGVFLEALQGFLYELKNPLAVFRQICETVEAQRWLQSMKDMRKDIFFITGVRSLVDAQVQTASKQSRTIAANIDVPVDAIVSAATIALPISFGGNVGGQVGRDVSHPAGQRFQAPGEQIYAVQYRRVRVKPLLNRDSSPHTLGNKVRWKDVLVARAAPEDNVYEAEASVALSLGKDFSKIADEDIDEEYLVLME